MPPIGSVGLCGTKERRKFLPMTPVSPTDPLLPDREAIRDILGRTALFNTLSPSVRWLLSEFVQPTFLDKDEILFNTGDPADSLYVVVQGRVIPTDFTFVFGTDPDDVIGEVWLFADATEPQLRHSGAKAEVDNTLVLRIPFTALERFRGNAAFLLALVQRHQRYTHWSLRERAMKGITRVVAEVDMPGGGK